MKVVIVSVSQISVQHFKNVLLSSIGFQFVGQASDPFSARDLILEKEPDVMLIRADLPYQNGIPFIHQMMRFYPLPILMILPPKAKTTLAERGRREGADVLVWNKAYNIPEFKNELLKRLQQLFALKRDYSSSHSPKEKLPPTPKN